ncbi:TPA: conjugal transfer protein TraS [Raoultella ornithinolytica]
MITNKIIIEEVDELRHMLLQGKAEVPSFWSCMWPGLVIVSWNILCAMISVNQNYLAVKYIFWVVIFPGGVGLILLLGIASARSLFFSVPKSFRVRLNIYRFFFRKIIVYAFVYMSLVFILAFLNRFFYDSPFPFGFMVFFTAIFMGIVMNLDFGRYQLSLLTSAITSFKAS